MTERVIMAGFGGQGLLFMGKLLAEMMMEKDFHVTWFPSYGAEVRGGTCNCHVIVSDEEIFSPVVERATTLGIMNEPSYTRFAPRLEPNGLLLLNTTMVPSVDAKSDPRIFPIPVTDLAAELGNVRVANMIMMGAYNRLRSLMTPEELLRGVKAALTGSKAKLFDLNRRAAECGAAEAPIPCRLAC